MEGSLTTNINILSSTTPVIGNYYRYCLLLLLFLAHQHKAAGVKIRLSINNNHDGVSHGIDCSQEGDRIPPLKSNRLLLLILLLRVFIERRISQGPQVCHALSSHLCCHCFDISIGK